MFAQFLCWRADLLPSEYLRCLWQVHVRPPAIPCTEMARALSAQLGTMGEGLARELEAEPCWNTLARCAYRTQYQGQAVVVQLARDPAPDEVFSDFESGLRRLDEEDTRPATAPHVLRQFRQWLRLADSSARERSYLETLSGTRAQTVVEYPRLIPELSTDSILCWPWVEGEPLSSHPAAGEAAVEKVTEAVLEQLLILSLVDGELDRNAMILTRSGRLAVRRANRLIAVPAASLRTALKYISSVLADDAPMAARFLLKLSRGQVSIDMENRLLDELSGLAPELKIDLQLPGSVSSLEAYWRALSRMEIEKPLFLDCLHRNLTAAGYWAAEAAGPGSAPTDWIAEAQWGVLGRLLRVRLNEMLTRDVASEWLVGSGLLFFESFRQMNRLAYGFRDNDLAVGVDAGQDGGEASRKANRTVRRSVLSGMLLIVFWLCLRWGVGLPAPFSTALGIVALFAAASLFWTIARSG